jgi:tetratricopeptide (TPR) repeat protein
MSLQVQYANAGSGLPLPPLDPIILGDAVPRGPSRPPRKQIDVAAFNEIYQKALSYLKRGEWERAQDAFREVVRLYPAAETYVLLGYSYFFAGEELKAANHFEKATRLNPQDEQAYFSLTLAYKGLGKIEKAVKAVRSVLRIDPDNPRAHFMLGYLQSRLGRWREAEAAYRRSVELKEDLGEAYQYLAVMHYEQGLTTGGEESAYHFREAIKVYQELLEKIPAASYVYTNIGQILDQLGEHEEAAAAYQKAVSAVGDNPERLAELGTSLLNARRYPEAKGVLERAINKLKGKPEQGVLSLPQLLTCSGVASLCMYAARAEGTGDEELLREAEELFNSALALDPHYIHALVDLAGVYYEQGRLGESEETFRKALERDPSNEAARDNLVAILEDRLEEQLIEKGLLKRAKPPIKDFAPYEGRKPIVITGRPLSETLLEDRR